MDLVWTEASLFDLDRIFRHLDAVNPRAAIRTIRILVATPRKLREFPHIRMQLREFEPREIRRIIANDYEIRYEVTSETIFLLRVWHTKEER